MDDWWCSTVVGGIEFVGAIAWVYLGTLVVWSVVAIVEFCFNNALEGCRQRVLDLCWGWKPSGNMMETMVGCCCCCSYWP